MASLSELIDLAGGTDTVASICGVKSPAVSRWRRLGRLPCTEIRSHQPTRYAEIISKRLKETVGLDAPPAQIRALGRVEEQKDGYRHSRKCSLSNEFSLVTDAFGLVKMRPPQPDTKANR
ncbi:hypothetical protein LMG33810_001220 [Carnimonas sp. LMG 33810]